LSGIQLGIAREKEWGIEAWFPQDGELSSGKWISDLNEISSLLKACSGKSHRHLSTGCPVAPIDAFQTDALPNLSIPLLASPAFWALLHEHGC